jgi:hypothetical protein
MPKSRSWQVFEFQEATIEKWRSEYRLPDTKGGTAQDAIRNADLDDATKLLICISDIGEIRVARKQPIPPPKEGWVFDNCDC